MGASLSESEKIEMEQEYAQVYETDEDNNKIYRNIESIHDHDS